MGLLEPITHKEEIETLVNDAQSKYDDAKQRLENQKGKTANSLERLGELKLQAWSGEMQDFLDVFNLFNNVQMVNKKSNLYQFAGRDEKPQELMLNIQRASMTANEVMKAGAIALSSGALIGIASYGGAMMFAHASTGTAIAALSGAAKTNATLAWFGGGSLAAGGLGKAGGKIVLGGITLAPILLVAGVIAAAKGKEKLAEAQKMHAEAEKAVAQMNTVISGMAGIEAISDNYYRFLKNLSSLFKPFIDEMDRISQDYSTDADGKIDFDELSEVEQKTLHISWLLAQLYYHSLSAVILTDDGNVAPEAKTILAKSEKEYQSIASEVSKLNSEKEEIRQLLSKTETSFDAARKNFDDKRLCAKTGLVAFGQKKIDLCVSRIKPIIDGLSVFEDIDITNTLRYTPFGKDTALVFEAMENAAIAADRVSVYEDEEVPDSAYIEMAAYAGMSFLSDASQQQELLRYMSEADRHDLSIWFAEEMSPQEDEQQEFCGVSIAEMTWAANVVSGISGKESLDEAKRVNSDVAEIVSRMNTSAHAAEKVTAKTTLALDTIRAVEKVLKPFSTEVSNISRVMGNEQAGTIPFAALSIADQKVIELFWNIAKLQFFVLDASLLPEADGSISDDIDTVCAEAIKELKHLRKTTFKMSGDCTKAADLVWKPYARKIMFGNFFAMAIFLVLACVQVINMNWYGLIGVAGALIAMPIFFYYKNLPQSKLYMWRIIRLVAASIVVLGVELLQLVG